MLFITPVHLLLLTNRGTEGIPLSRFDFYHLVSFCGVVCLTRTIIFMLNLSPAFCTGSFHLLPPAWSGVRSPRADRWGGTCTRCRLFLSTKQVFSIRESSCRWENTYPLFIQRNVPARCTLCRLLWAQLNPLGQAGGALMLLPPATLEHWGRPAEQALSAQSTLFIPPFLDIQSY